MNNQCRKKNHVENDDPLVKTVDIFTTLKQLPIQQYHSTNSSVENVLVQIILEQLHQYSSTGQRKRSVLQVAKIIGKSEPTTRKMLRKILPLLISPIRSDIQKANTVYRMIFGRIITSYQDLKRGALKAKVRLITTPTVFFKMIQENSAIAHLKVRIECIRKHRSLRDISDLKNANHTCKICADFEWEKNANKLNLGREITLNKGFSLARDRNLELVSFTNPELSLTQTEFNDLKQTNTLLNKRNRDIVLKWKHRDCKRTFNSRYRNIQEATSHCPYCNANLDQKITHNMAELIFRKYSSSKKFESEKRLGDILAIEGCEDLLELNMKSINEKYRNRITIDIFAVLNINGREIKLSIEHDGAQHDKREKIGVQATIGISKINGIPLTYKRAKDRWNAQLKRDDGLRDLFDLLKSFDYFLIQVPYTVKGTARYKFIINEFKRRTGETVNFNLAKAPDWRSLLKIL